MALPYLAVAALVAIFHAIYAKEPPHLKIYDVQGAAHSSPYVGSTLSTSGIVTAVARRGFYLQDPTGDADTSTSDALFVYTHTVPSVRVADAVNVTGRVNEYIPGGTRTANLPVTQLVAAPAAVIVRSSDNALPAPVIIGTRTSPNTRTVPLQHIDDDSFTVFDPDSDALDFFESLEGMLITVRDPVTIAPRSRFGDVWVVPDNGALSDLGPRGALPISNADFNPERIRVAPDNAIFDTVAPDAPVGTRMAAVTGVLSYSLGTYAVIPTRKLAVTRASALKRMTTRFAPSRRAAITVNIATINALNIAATDGIAKFARLAAIVVRNLREPDVIALQEVQDANGKEKEGTISAAATLQALVDAISREPSCGWWWACPSYAFIDNPFIERDASGGQPGSNIRTAFLYRTDRVEVVHGSVRTVVDVATQRTDRKHPFYRSRLPLAVSFRQLRTARVFEVVNVHFSSKGGSAPLFGVYQPADMMMENSVVNGNVDTRVRQATAVRDYVLTKSEMEQGRVVVTGDFNEFEFVKPLSTIEEAGLALLTDRVPRGLRYSYIFRGNAQTLDHFLVGKDFEESAEIEIVHVNTEFGGAVSDHDPVLVRFSL